MSADEKYSISGIPLKSFYTRTDIENPGAVDHENPGQHPFLRGIFAHGYRKQPWMESLACGYGLPEETNERVRYLAKVGQAGYSGRLSINLVFDRPTFCGMDSDDPRGEAEVGNIGVSVNSLADMERLFDGFDLTQLNVGFIVDRSGPFILAMYIALADRRGVPRDELRGIVCNNPLTDFFCSKTPMFPLAQSLRLMVDCIKFCIDEAPRFNATRINGYNTRELGADAIQEVGFNLAIARSIVAACIAKGMKSDQVASRINFQFSQGRDFFEDICKIRAARRIWARMLRETFSVEDENSCRLKIHMQTAGSSLTAQEPLNNIARIALQVMSGALAGTQSMHIASYDEALGIPTEDAARVAIKTSKIVMHESGITKVADPLGGSYYVESLTDEIEIRVLKQMEEVENLGGVIRALETGYFEQEIADTSYLANQAVECGDEFVVGVNCYREEGPVGVGEIFRPDPERSRIAIDRVRQLRRDRDQQRAGQCLSDIKAGAAAGEPMMPLYIEAAKADVTLGEMIGAMEDTLGGFDHMPITAKIA